MKELPNITLIVCDCHFYGEAITAIKKTLLQIKPKATKFFTDIAAYNPNFPFEIVKIPKISSKAEYSRWIMKELWKHIETDYVLIIQHDSWVLSGDAWSDDFLNYDVVGPAWLYTDGRNCANGGFTLRSKRLMEILGTDDFISVCDVEDDNIGRLYRGYLEQKYNIKFAPDDVCDRFAFELREPICPTFGFHSNFHKPYQPTVVVKRSGALGDIIATEPLLEYYHKKGYHVAIDMPIHLCMFFGMHFFPVKHVSQLDERIPRTVIDLDMSYEENPKQLHLKSYYEKAGITDGEIRNPRLKFPIDDSNRLFKKYIVLHIDNRDQEARNIYGVDWEIIVDYFNEKGYTVIQVGQYDHHEVEGAIQMTTQTTQMLLYVVAGAEGFIGVDSGVSNMAVACGIKSVIFCGSVNPEYIYPDLTNIRIVHKHHGEGVCNKKYCWHETIGTTGTPCYIDEQNPPCVQFRNEEVFEALNDFL